MKVWLSVIIVGMIVFAMGIVFHLQGKSIVGPETSFMYASKNWELYGLQFSIAGAIILISGIVIKIVERIKK